MRIENRYLYLLDMVESCLIRTIALFIALIFLPIIVIVLLLSIYIEMARELVYRLFYNDTSINM